MEEQHYNQTCGIENCNICSEVKAKDHKPNCPFYENENSVCNSIPTGDAVCTCSKCFQCGCSRPYIKFYKK